MSAVIITGGNNGIGFYMVSQLLKEGKKVAVFDLELDNLDVLREKYENNLLCYECDVSDPIAVNNCVQKVIETFERIDCVVHNACKCLFTDLEHTTENDYLSVLKVNYFGALNITKAVVPYMKNQNRGRVIFTCSGVGIMGFVNISAYASSKGAIESLAKCLNIEYQNTGITFHIMHPPLTRTKSASPLPVPNEFKADPEKVGIGLARNINKNRFIICHSVGQAFQVKLSYLFPISFGKLLSKMTAKVKSPSSSNV